jgi:copper chaperone CopZ
LSSCEHLTALQSQPNSTSHFAYPSNHYSHHTYQQTQLKMAEHNYKFNITMTCGGCSGAVERVLKKLDGEITAQAVAHQSSIQKLTYNLQASRTSTSPSRAKPQPSQPMRTWTTQPSWRRSRRPAKLSTRARPTVLRRRCKHLPNRHAKRAEGAGSKKELQGVL